MNSDLLITFLKLNDTRNYTRAADELFITQPTVTTRIATLEEELGCRLFQRNRKGLQLTPAGEALVDYAERILDLEKTAAQSIHLAGTRITQLRIGINETIFDSYLAPRMKSFMETHPDYHIRFTLGNSVNLFQAMQEGLLDLIYTHMPFEKRGFICEQMLSEHFALVVSPDYKKPLKKIHLEELLKTDLIFTDYVLSFSNQWLQELFPSHYDFPFTIKDGTKALKLVLNGLGYSFLPRSLCVPYIERGELLLVEPRGFSLPLYQVFHVRTEKCPEADGILQWE